MNRRLETRRRLRGIKLGKRPANLCRWIFPRRTGYQRSDPYVLPKFSWWPVISRLRSWGRRLKIQAKEALCSSRQRLLPCPDRGYAPLGCDPEEGEVSEVPKGHLAVYVGEEDGEWQRVVVPAVYFNHPLFGGLLREAEKEYGFHQPPGGLTIPCRISEFESVRTRIAAVQGRCGWHHPVRGRLLR